MRGMTPFCEHCGASISPLSGVRSFNGDRVHLRLSQGPGMIPFLGTDRVIVTDLFGKPKA